MYLISMSIYKPKGDSHTCIEMPSFFRYDESFEEVRKYLDANFRDVAVLYVECLPDPDPDDPITI